MNDQSENEESNSEAIQLFEKESVYLIHAKFSATSDGSLYVSITNNVLLDIPHEDIPVSKPLVHLLGRTSNVAVKTQVGYQVSLQVKPYLSSDHCGPISVTLLHGLEGRLKKAFENTRKFSLVHATGILVVHENNLYCEILEYQFVSSKTDNSTNITVPWKQNNSSIAESSSSIEKRIATAHKLATTAQSSTSSKRNRSPKGKGKAKKISDVALSLLDNEQTDNSSKRSNQQKSERSQDTLPDEQSANNNSNESLDDTDSEDSDEPEESQKRSRLDANMNKRATRNSNK
jgi:hypothetical protein